MRVVVVDSGVGNVPNAARGLIRAGAQVVISADPEIVGKADRLVLPGVGAFPAAMERLRAAALDAAIRQAVGAGAALLGICLGHQLLFEGSDEFGATAGLGLLPGRVTALAPTARIPHMGWSVLRLRRPDPLVQGLGERPWMYFVHSFVAAPANGDLIASVAFGESEVCAAVRRGSVCGAQFHPEKSGAAGARFLENFLTRVG